MKAAENFSKKAKPYEKVGLFLKNHRVKKGFTQRQVSEALAYADAQLVSNLERGLNLPSLRKLKLLVDLLDVNPEELVDKIFEAEGAVILPVLRAKIKKR